VPFKSLGAVSYLPFAVTVTISVAVCEIFSVKKWCGLENRVWVRSRSLEMVPFDRSRYSMSKKWRDLEYQVKVKVNENGAVR